MAKTIRKVIGGLLIATALIVTQIPALPTRADRDVDFLMDHETLAEYTGTATVVSVPDDVVTIGEEAFANNQYIGVVNLGNTKHIEHGAFANCSYLGSVNMGSSTVDIGSAAFSGCSNLTSVNIGSSVADIGTGAFAACNNLTRLTVDSSNQNFMVEDQVLYSKDQSKLYAYLGGNKNSIYVMPESVEYIEPYSFWGNTNLEDVAISGCVDSISGYAFANCTNLKSVTIPYSVNTIDAKAFENCISLGTVKIPASVTYIDPTAFDGCYNLNIEAEEGTAAYEFFKNFDKSDISVTEGQDAKDLVNTIGQEDTDTQDSGDTTGSVTYVDASQDPHNVEWMPSVDPLKTEEDSSLFGKTIVVSGRALLFIDRDMPVSELSQSDATVADNDTAEVSSDTEEDSGDSQVVYDSQKGGYLPKYTEVNGKIAMQAYYGADDMENYTMPSGITSIGRFSFARSNLKSIDIPEGVTSIGYGAFYHCSELTDVSIPSSVTKIDEYAFENTPFLTNAKAQAQNGFVIVGNGILLAYGGSASEVSIPNSVKTIAAGAFKDNTSLRSVTIPDSVTAIEADAFRGCVNLTAVNGAKGVKTIGDRAFMDCPLNNFTVSGSVESMGLRAVDFASSSKSDDTKLVIFEGSSLPSISADETSMRLSNSDYRTDVLRNVLFAIVDEGVQDFDNTVLDDEKLGFSGIVLSLNESEHTAEVKADYIFSEEVLASLPDFVTVNGESYTIEGLDEAAMGNSTRTSSDTTKELSVRHNNNIEAGYSAAFTAAVNAGVLYINDSRKAADALNDAYSELFGGDRADITGYEITLMDATETCKINRFGNNYLSVTLPLSEIKEGTYHVITLDEDGQLEELNASLNSDNSSITFATGHLSYVGIYCNESDTTLNLKDGRLVKNQKLDDSPDTGDLSININYVIALGMGALGLLLILTGRKKRL